LRGSDRIRPNACDQKAKQNQGYTYPHDPRATPDHS
jgi:hypothetical protein